MKKTSVFEYLDYKSYIKATLKIMGAETSARGLRTRLAEAAQCHTAFVSQVLNGRAHFSLEQAARLTGYFGFTKDEKTYFILLVQHNRAGIKELKDHFAEQMSQLAQRQHVLKERLSYDTALTRDDQAKFYSSWIFGAIHVLVSVRGCNTVEGIARYLGISQIKTVDALDFLNRVGLVIKNNGKYEIGKSHIHLGHDEPMINKHHTNWRMMAIRSLEHVRPNELHYSSVITCSEKDALRIKQVIVEAIDSVRAIVRPSSNEGAFVYCFDLFGLKSDLEP
jgi:uncharacterized protein (TIGR02147 family)